MGRCSEGGTWLDDQVLDRGFGPNSSEYPGLFIQLLTTLRELNRFARTIRIGKSTAGDRFSNWLPRSSNRVDQTRPSAGSSWRQVFPLIAALGLLACRPIPDSLSTSQSTVHHSRHDDPDCGERVAFEEWPRWMGSGSNARRFDRTQTPCDDPRQSLPGHDFRQAHGHRGSTRRFDGRYRGRRYVVVVLVLSYRVGFDLTSGTYPSTQ